MTVQDLDRLIEEYLAEDAELLWMGFRDRFEKRLTELDGRIRAVEAERNARDEAIERLQGEKKSLEETVARRQTDTAADARLRRELAAARTAAGTAQRDVARAAEALASLTRERDAALAALEQWESHECLSVDALLGLDHDDVELVMESSEVVELTLKPVFMVATRGALDDADLRVGPWSFVCQPELDDGIVLERRFDPPLNVSEAVEFARRTAEPVIGAVVVGCIDPTPASVHIAGDCSFYSTPEEAVAAVRRLGAPPDAAMTWSQPITPVEAERWAEERGAEGGFDPASDRLVDWLQEQDLIIQDSRPAGGRLWVYGPAEVFEPLMPQLLERGVRFRWAPARRGWWTDYGG